MSHIKVNMKDFNSKWKDYSDNIKYGEIIRENKGSFDTLDNRPYIEWLTQFGINFTTDIKAKRFFV